MISKILVPTDGSKTAQKAAQYAIDLAKRLKASIIILSVIDIRTLITQSVVPGGERRFDEKSASPPVILENDKYVPHIRKDSEYLNSLQL